MGIKHVVSVSGGKDSAATLILALENCAREDVIPIFCDTGNEHEHVHAYLTYLEQALDIKIHRLKADFTEQIASKRLFVARDQRIGRDKFGRKIRWSNKAKRRALSVLQPTGNPFLDLCIWKGRFPSRMAQFCTQELKRDVAVLYQLDLIEQGHSVLSWQGVRRDESPNRRHALRVEKIGPKMRVFRPIVDWTASDVFAYCAARGVQPNPLYLQGMTRVGCMPCINVGKQEMRQIAERFPDHIERIAQWERIVGAASKRGFSTFKGDAHEGKDNRKVSADLNIWQRVEWSKTTHGGRQFDLFVGLSEPTACASAYGLCG